MSLLALLLTIVFSFFYSGFVSALVSVAMFALGYEAAWKQANRERRQP